MDFTNYLADRLVQATVRNVAWTSSPKVYLALYTEDPTKAGFSSNEVSGVSYNRQEITFTAPVDGVATNSSQIDVSVATSNWGNVGWVSIMDSETGGFMLYFTALDDARNILTGDQFKVDADKLQLKLT